MPCACGGRGKGWPPRVEVMLRFTRVTEREQMFLC